MERVPRGQTFGVGGSNPSFRTKNVFSKQLIFNIGFEKQNDILLRPLGEIGRHTRFRFWRLRA